MRDRQHVRLGLIGGYHSGDLKRRGIDDRHRVVQLRCDVKQAVRSPHRKMRSNAAPEIDVAGYFVRSYVDYDHVAAIGSGQADTRVAVDGHIRKLAIG